jgi:dephospho-CoA kinase
VLGKRMKIIGITGNFKTGKSTVLKLFAAEGLEVIDADKLAHTYLAKEQIIQAIKNRFPQEADLIKDGRINRNVLGQLVFNNQDDLRWLNTLIHPLVISDIKKRLNEIKKSRPESLVAVEIPLLYEAQLQDLVDVIIVVSLERNIQLERAASDGFSEEESLKRIESQLDLTKKEDQAHFIINNSGNVENTKKQVIDILKEVNKEKI